MPRLGKRCVRTAGSRPEGRERGLGFLGRGQQKTNVGLYIPLHFRFRERKVHRWNFRTFQVTKVPWSESTWDIRSWEAKVPRVRKFLDFSLHWGECFRERKFHGNESSICGLFAPGNESAEERKVQIPKNGHCSACQYVFLLNCIIQVVGWLKYNRDDWLEVVKL